MSKTVHGFQIAPRPRVPHLISRDPHQVGILIFYRTAVGISHPTLDYSKDERPRGSNERNQAFTLAAPASLHSVYLGRPKNST
jgi:hypothetical protein